MAQNEVMSPRETLTDQFAIMQKLYVELEQEREASATAASEALSMILRLQGEKAAEKLEACQYKRLTEEKIHHAEESVAILEEMLYQKEIEIAALKLQVQTYRDKLSRPISPTVSGANISKIPPLRKAKAFSGSMSSQETVRSISLPIISKKMCSDIDIVEEEVLSLQMRQPIPKYFNSFIRYMNDRASVGSHCCMLPDMSEESPISNCNVHCDQIAHKHESTKETSDTRTVKENVKSDCILEHCKLQMSMPIASMSSESECVSCSWYSAISGNTCDDSTMKVAETNHGIEGASSSCFDSEDTENFQHSDPNHCSYWETKLPRNTIHATHVHDIFEVPRDDYYNEPQNKPFTDSTPEKEDASSTSCSMTKEVRDYYFRHNEWLIKDQDGQRSTMLYMPRKGEGPDYSSASNKTRIGIPFHQCVELWQAHIQQLEKRLQVLEEDRMIMKREDSDRKEQLKLLKEMSEQLSMLRSQIKKPLAEKYLQDDALIVSVMEHIALDRMIMKREDSDRKEQLKLLKEMSEQLSMLRSQIKKPLAEKYLQDDALIVSVMEAMLCFSI